MNAVPSAPRDESLSSNSFRIGSPTAPNMLRSKKFSALIEKSTIIAYQTAALDDLIYGSADVSVLCLVFLAFKVDFERAFVAVIHIVDQPPSISFCQSDRVGRRVPIFTRLWKGKCRSHGCSIALLESRFYGDRFMQLAAARLASFVNWLEGEPIPEVRFVTRIPFQVRCFSPEFIPK